MTKPPDPLAPLRSRSYLALLALAAIIGVPVSAAAFGFLALVNKLQGWIYTSLPRGLGFHATPVWWPIPLLAISGGHPVTVAGEWSPAGLTALTAWHGDRAVPLVSVAWAPAVPR